MYFLAILMMSLFVSKSFSTPPLCTKKEKCLCVHLCIDVSFVHGTNNIVFDFRDVVKSFFIILICYNFALLLLLLCMLCLVINKVPTLKLTFFLKKKKNYYACNLVKELKSCCSLKHKLNIIFFWHRLG